MFCYNANLAVEKTIKWLGKSSCNISEIHVSIIIQQRILKYKEILVYDSRSIFQSEVFVR